MSHSFSLISTLAIGFAIAWALGFLMERIKVPALVGYLLAGIIISPATPGFVGDVNIASELSEIGVMLLMFGVGLHFSMTDLIRVKNIAVPGAILQMGLATCLGAVLAHFWGWPWGQSIVFGMCLSCASTVVLLKGLESRGILESGDGQIAVGWLVVEDIMTVLILVLLPPLASLLGSPLQNTEASLPLWQIVGITLAQVFGFIILMLVVGKRLLPWLLRQVAKTGSRELFTLSVLVFAIGIAYGAAQIFHVSFALGAFFSGMVMRESRYSHRAAMAGRTATSPYVAGDTTVDTSKGGAWASEGLVSFGYTETTGEGEGATSVTRNRTLTGVAAGSEDNDAVNVAQLKQLESNTATQLSNLMTGETKVSTIQLTADPNDVNAPTIGLRYEAAKAEPVALEDGDQGMEISQGRLVYNNLDAAGQPVGDPITVATLNDGITISAGSSSSAARDGTESVKVDLNKGISFLTDSEYLSTNVAADGNGGAVVTFNTTQALKDALANAGGNTGGNTGGDSGNTGDTGGSGWNPSQAQLAAMNGNFANGITVAPGEGNQAIQIKQGNVDMGGNRIQNVGNPINDGDAANKAYVDSTSRSLRNKINDVDKDLRAGVAMAMAVGGLPQAYMPGKSIFGVSAGTYHGQGGFALGLSHATDNRQWVFKGAASVDTRGNFGGQLSAGYQF